MVKSSTGMPAVRAGRIDRLLLAQGPVFIFPKYYIVKVARPVGRVLNYCDIMHLLNSKYCPSETLT